MKYLKLFENYKSIRCYNQDIVDEISSKYNESNGEYKIFFRDTENPIADLERGLSCNFAELEYTDDYKEAIELNKKYTTWGIKPFWDNYQKKYCIDPERGLSSYCFEDNIEDFKHNLNSLYGVSGACRDKLAIFKSNDYTLQGGWDDEDLFRNGEFLGWFDVNSYVNCDPHEFEKQDKIIKKLFQEFKKQFISRI